MQKVILEGFIEFSDQDLPLILNELAHHVSLTRREEGCVIFQVDQDLEKKNRFKVYEEFKSRLDFEHHQERVKASYWGKITQNAVRSYSIKYE